MSFIVRTLLIALLLAGASTIQAQSTSEDERGIKVEERTKEPTFTSLGFGSKRIALVIGNQNYEHISVLGNPIKDARDIADSLQKNGDFDVVLGLDLTFFQFNNKVAEFKQKLAASGPNSVGLVFYAGHGFEFKGENYLLPTDLNVSSGNKETVVQSSISLNRIIEALEPSPHSTDIVILDACRNDPFSQNANKSTYSLENASGGWAKIEQAGLFAAFGTLPGKTAADGDPGRNGIFTQYILKEMKEPGKTIDNIFTEVRGSVNDRTGGAQTPVVFSSITESFILHECETGESCGNSQMLIIYGMFGLMGLMIIGGFGYIRRLALQNHTSIGAAFELATEGLTQLVVGKKTAGKDNLNTAPLVDDDNNDERIVGYLRHVRHNREVAHIKSGHPITVGREKSSAVNVVISDTKGHIARVQTRIGWDTHNKCFWIMDLGSRNGTYLSRDEKMKPHEIYYVNAGQTFYLASKYHPMTIIKAEV